MMISIVDESMVIFSFSIVQHLYPVRFFPLIGRFDILHVTFDLAS